MTLILRPAIPADAPILIDFNQRLALESEGKQLDSEILTSGVTSGLHDKEKARYFVALDRQEQREEYVGQLMLTTEWSDWRNGWLWWIQSVYVPPTARRKGVFRALYEYVRSAAQMDPAVKGLRLYVEIHNETALATYHRLGMIDSGYKVLEEIFPLR